MEGDILRQGADLFPANFDHDDRVEEMAGSQLLVQQLFLDVDEDGFLIVSVNDGGYAALTAQSAGGSLASPIACLGRQHKLIAHRMSPGID